MPKLYTKISIFTAFAVLLALLMLNALVTRRQLGVQIEKRVWSAHSQQVLLKISEIGSLFKDAETGQRGYLYTRNPHYLGPYTESVNRVQPAIAALAELTADNPRQHARLPILRDLAHRKLDELAQTIALDDAGKTDEARAVVLSGSGQLIMEQIRGLLADMWQEEINLSAERNAEYDRSVRKTIWSIYLATVVAIVGLALLAHYVLLQIRQRERHGAEIRAREEWFRITLGSIGDAVLATDEQGTVTYMNEIARELTGFQLHEVSGKLVKDVFPIFNEQTLLPVENPVAKVFALGKVVGLANHTVLRHRDGRLIPIEDSAAPIRDDQHRIIGVVLVFRDASQERHSQQLLRRAEKLAAAGRLAATMAHEINNPLEAVGNLLFIAKNAATIPSEAKDYLALAEQQLERVAHITRQTLGFYREPATPHNLDLASLTESVLALYDNKLKSKRITVERDFHEAPAISGLSGELKQLVANLISNAADAVDTGGKLVLSIAPAAYEGREGVEFTVSDNGPGISAENLDRIFEPFFTTKADVGTGLGLWVVKEIAERHSGAVRVLSRNAAGNGAAFSVFLPSLAEGYDTLSTSA
jgi:PAS domain S-box-containing protein